MYVELIWIMEELLKKCLNYKNRLLSWTGGINLTGYFFTHFFLHEVVYFMQLISLLENGVKSWEVKEVKYWYNKTFT